MIGPSSAVANFTANVTYGTAPLPVSFTDTSSNSPTGWAWYFGDENFTAPWTQVNASSGWTARYAHSSVAMPDGSIVLMGGYDDIGKKNDVWRSKDNGTTWTQVNASAGWTARGGHSSVVMPDGSIVLMGGVDGGSYKNDVWRSTDDGATWTQVNVSAGWSGRIQHSSVAMPDGSIVLMGGYDNFLNNDVWRSTDNGTTWTRMTASAGWTPRYGHSSVAMKDGSIVLMGGGDISGEHIYKNDVWRSTNNGTTWTHLPDAGWSAREGHSSVAMPDGSIVLIGGWCSGAYIYKNDVWRSTNYGATWTQVNASAGWTERFGHSSVAMPDGSIVLTGGWDSGGVKNDTWRFVPTGSSARNPVHTYTAPGIYTVALQAYNAGGYNSTRKAGYITVTGPAPASSAVMFHFNARHTGDYSPVAGITGTTVTKLWNFTTGGFSAAMDPSPVVANGIVYIGSGDGNFYALNATTGAQIWTNTTGYTISSTPAIANGIVYFGSEDQYVYALNATTGTKVWTYNTGAYIYSSPTIANNTVYIADDTVLHALDATTGTQLWSKTLAGGSIYSIPAVANDVVYIGSTNKNLYAIGATNGTQLWTFTAISTIISSPAVANGLVYFGSGTKVYSLNAITGAPIWNMTDPDSSAWFASSPAIVNETVYIGDSHIGNVRALNASNGAPVWNYTAGGGVMSSPAVANGVVFVGSYDNNVYAIDANTGTNIWTFTTGGTIGDSPAIANGILYIESEDRNLYALTISGSSPPPVANFTANITSGPAPLAVQFNDTSTGSPTIWNWSFGDGGISPEQNPFHTYGTPGTYSVSLNVTNGHGSDTMEKARYITIYPKGDFNTNWRVDISDVTRVAYMVVGLIPQDPRADFHKGNGTVLVGDAAKIAWYYVGKVAIL